MTSIIIDETTLTGVVRAEVSFARDNGLPVPAELAWPLAIADLLELPDDTLFIPAKGAFLNVGFWEHSGHHNSRAPRSACDPERTWVAFPSAYYRRPWLYVNGDTAGGAIRGHQRPAAISETQDHLQLRDAQFARSERTTV